MAVNFEVAFSKITDTQSTWDFEVTICKTCILTKSCQNWLIYWLTEQCLTFASTQYRLYGRRFLQVWWPNQQCQSTEGGWLVIQTGLNLTMLTSPCYNMHADIKQENNLIHTQRNLSTVSESSEMKPNLADRTCKLLKWLCNYRKLHNTTTREQLWQYSLLLLTKP